MRLTNNADVIYDYFVNHPDLHPSALEVYDYLRKHQIKIGIATVYRSLNNLVDKNLIREISLEKQGVFYDLLKNEHFHFICDKCGKIENFVCDTLLDIDPVIEGIVHGKVIQKDLLFHGSCTECLNKI